MSLISLVCLLALSSSALGRSTYGSFSSQSLVKPKINSVPTSYSYGNTQTLFDVPRAPLTAPMTSNYGSSYSNARSIQPTYSPMISSGYGSAISAERSFPTMDQLVAPKLPLSDVDIACKGKRPETILPLGQGEKYIVCTDESKGDLMTCPKDLFWTSETQRCERKISLNENVCASQPCLNGGLCVQTQYSYQCQCAPGYTGKTCELDSTVCDTQKPCGQSSDSFCQSFHVGAALSHVCILRDGLAYGISAQQVNANPCQAGPGPHALAFSNKGFLMCDGDQLFVQSCPGGTLWDDVNKACVWPDMVGVVSITASDLPIQQGYGQTTYGSQVDFQRPSISQVEIQRPMFNQVEVPRVAQLGQMELPRVSEYGQMDLPRVSEYAQMDLPRVSQYGQVDLPRVSQYGQMDLPRVSQHIQTEFPRAHHHKHHNKVETQRSVAPWMQKSVGY